VAVGLAHIAGNRHRYTALSLVPDRVRERRRLLTSVPFLVASGVLLVVTLVATAAYLKVQEDEVSRATADYHKAVERLEADQKDLDAKEAGFRETWAKLDRLQSQSTAARGIMETYAKLRRFMREGVKIEKFDLKEGAPVKRFIANVQDRGHVPGVFQPKSEDDVSVTLEGIGPVRRQEIVNWESPRYKLVVSGEVDENLKGGAQEVLQDLKGQLTDPIAGTSAEVQRQDPSPKRPGWRAFSIEVTFQ
jgi:hypothetical protein